MSDEARIRLIEERLDGLIRRVMALEKPAAKDPPLVPTHIKAKIPAGHIVEWREVKAGDRYLPNGCPDEFLTAYAVPSGKRYVLRKLPSDPPDTVTLELPYDVFLHARDEAWTTTLGDRFQCILDAEYDRIHKT